MTDKKRHYFVVDYTKGGNFKGFNKKVIKYLLENKSKRFIQIIDYIFPLKKTKKKLFPIKDHVNLSGYNPLTGPNFVSLSNAYNSKKGIIVAGLKEGSIPNNKEKNVLLSTDIKAYSYNLVPTVILACAYGLKIKAFGIVSTNNLL